MSKNKKYDIRIENTGTTWQAQIIRHASSKKTVISKQQNAFKSEESAQQWAEQQLQEFTSTQDASNKRHGEQRKLNEEQRRQRSSRRAKKTEKAKLEKLNAEPEPATATESDTDPV